MIKAPKDMQQELHRSEVRYVLKMRDEKGAAVAKAWLDSLVPVRGAESVQRLRDDANFQWKAGNRGLAGDWRQV